MESAGIYDLGEVERSSASQRIGDTSRPRGVSAGRVQRGSGDSLGWIPPSLSLLVPGSGQFIVGSHGAGLFFLSLIGFLAALAWAIHNSIGRLADALPWLGLPPQVAFWFLPVAWVAAAAVHVMGVLHAYSIASDESATPHPLAAAFASLLVPGWGQILNGALWRAAFLLSGLWIMGGVAWMVLPAGTRLLRDVGMSPILKGAPPWIGPAMLAVPIVIWILAAYDAAACAAGRRR